MTRRRVAVLGSLAFVACARDPLPPRGHIEVYLDTDAPLPREGVPAERHEAMALLDTARIEIVTDTGVPACNACVREVPLEEKRIEAGFSFNVVLEPDLVARTRMHVVAFRSEQAAAAGPAATVELWARLPEPPAEGGRVVTVDLPVGDIGRPRGTLAVPVDLREGPPKRPRSSFPSATRSQCLSPAPRQEAVCVPGGAFWMGSATDAGVPSLLAPRIVALSAFWLDAHEVTVAELRASGSVEGVFASSGDTRGTHEEDFCTFTPSPGRFDDYPVNCVPFDAARRHCIALGGDLPTEAQHEYVRTALIGLPFAWGREPLGCDDAVVGRGPRFELLPEIQSGYHRDCLPDPNGDPVLEALGFPKPVHRPSLGRDVLALSGGTIWDLYGNMAEWSVDDWQFRDESCWSAATLRIDPRCGEGAGSSHPLKGLSWVGLRDALPASHRVDGGLGARIAIGFRCAYPGR